MRRRLLGIASHLGLGQIAGTALGLVGVLVLTRLIGPREYGLYVTAQAVSGVVRMFARWEIPTYLVRKRGGLGRSAADVSFTLLLLFSLAGFAAALLFVFPLASWLNNEAVVSLTVVLLCGLPVGLASCVPLVLLERALRFRAVVACELSAQGTYVVFAVAFAWGGAGAWAAVAASLIQQAVLAGLFFTVSGYRPRLAWGKRRARVLCQYGAKVTLTMGIWQLRSLINPLLVGRLLGTEAVGAVALAARIVEAASIAKRVAWRLGLPLLARVQDDTSRMLAALREGALLQVLGVGIPLLTIAWFGPSLSGVLLGERWGQAFTVFPFLAAGQVINAHFSLHSAAFLVRGRIGPVAIFHLLHFGLLAAGVWLGMVVFGIKGYGFGEVLALGSYVGLHRHLLAEWGTPRQTESLLLAVCIVSGLFLVDWGWFALLPISFGLSLVLMRWGRARLVHGAC